MSGTIPLAGAASIADQVAANVARQHAQQDAENAAKLARAKSGHADESQPPPTNGTPLATITALRERLWACGYRPIAIYSYTHPDPAQAGKAPLGKDWPERARQDPPEAAVMPAVAHAGNTGILADGFRAIDIDIDDPELAGQVRALAHQMLGDTETRHRPNSGRCLVLYRAAEGSPAKRTLTGAGHSKEHACKIEILGLGQQFVSHGTHPSGAEIYWHPEPLEETAADSLPAVSEDQISAFLKAAARLIDATYTEDRKASPGAPGYADNATPADILDVIAALAVIPNDGPADWEFWNNVGLATWAASGGSQFAFAAWDAWSAKHPEYDATACRKRWEHYPTSPPDRTGAGKLYALAAKAIPGWQRPSELRRKAEREAFARERATREHGRQKSETSDEEPSEREEKFRFPLVPFPEIKALRSAAYLIRKILPREGLCVVWGPPKCGKTFWLSDAVLHVAAGWNYRGFRVKQGAVVYVACEGERGLGARIEAWRSHHQVSMQIPFWLLTTRLDVAKEWEVLVNDIRAQVGNLPIAAIVIDTLNRSIGGSESSDEDMGAYIKACDAIREAFGGLVILVHHCGLDKTRPRGHTSLLGAADAQIAVTHPAKGALLAKVEYMKDGEAGTEVGGRLKVVDLGTDEDGESITSLIIEPADAPSDKLSNLTRAELSALRFLHDLVVAEGKALPVGRDYPKTNPPLLGVPVERWRAECRSRGVGNAETPNGRSRAITSAIDGLTHKQRVAQRDGIVWVP